MRVVEALPHSVREVENVWIPMPDGCRLAARLWLPEGAGPVPAILEYLPYRKRDGTRWRDEPMHRYFAGHGYAAVRVDLRGSGESDGVLLDEYLPQEQQDGVDVIAWIAAQPWCDGSVGMMGKSWGGFNSLQVAARRPPALNAILTVCSTDDRYADDAHFMGGCLLNENLIWGSVLFTINAQPPDPALVGPRWRAMWLERLENAPLFPETWLRHPHRDDYWRHGSVCEDFPAIACPVYAVGGWADGYTNAVPRLLAGLSAPRKGLVGPWAHLYPHEGRPGPAIGFLQEALRWWDRWLRGEDNGIDREPTYRAWMQEGTGAAHWSDVRPGRWVAEDAWPSPRIRRRRTALGAGEAKVRSPQTVGACSGSWSGLDVEGEIPADQAEDDARSVCFDTEPLDERLEILGAPVATLTLRCDRPLGMVAVRLEDVAPEGSSTRVTYGLLNLAHRNGHERPEPLEPGRRYEVAVRLNDAAHAFLPGHRMRLALSTSYWPLVWPPPEPFELAVDAAASAIELPVRPPRAEDAALRPFPPPEAAPPLEAVDLHPGGVNRAVTRDPETGDVVHTTTYDVTESGGAALSRVEAIDLVVGHAITETFRIRDDDPLSARAEVSQETRRRRDGWSTRVRTRLRFSATRDAFRLEVELEAWDGEERVFSRAWDRTIPRQLV